MAIEYGWAIRWRGLTTTFDLSGDSSAGWRCRCRTEYCCSVCYAAGVDRVGVVARGKDEGGRRQEEAPKSSGSRMLDHLTLWFALTFGGYVYYNLTFVQHQGRYLFPALIPIGLVFAIG